MKNQFIFFFILSMAVFSCKKAEDKEAPVIEFVRVNGIVAAEHHVNAGTIMNVEVRVSDNKELNQVKLSIHAADDGHSHTSGGSGSEGPNTGVWSSSRIINLEGTSATRNAQFPVPSDIAGYWHLEVMLIDRAGNQSEEYITTIHVENDNLPVIVITTNPAAVDGEVEIAVGETLMISAEVTDATGLAEVHVEVENENGTVIFEDEIELNGETTYSYGPVTVPFPDAGHYHLHVKARDTDGFVSMKEIEIHVE